LAVGGRFFEFVVVVVIAANNIDNRNILLDVSLIVGWADGILLAVGFIVVRAVVTPPTVNHPKKNGIVLAPNETTMS
jgi:hypothetical protein